MAMTMVGFEDDGLQDEIVLTQERPRDAVLRLAKPGAGKETIGQQHPFPEANSCMEFVSGNGCCFQMLFLQVFYFRGTSGGSL